MARIMRCFVRDIHKLRGGGLRSLSDYFGELESIQPKRVAVTGLGLVTPLGIGVQENWARIIKGETAVRQLTPEDLPEGQQEDFDKLPSRVVACVDKDELSACSWAPSQDERRTSLFMKYAAIAAEEALMQADWKPDSEEAKCYTGVSIGSGMSSTRDMASAAQLVAAGSLRKLSPLFVPKILSNMAAGDVSVRYKLKGPNLSTSTACAASAHAIGDAFRNIQLGEAKVMIAGGTEGCIDVFALMGFGRLRALSTAFNDEAQSASRPFDFQRDGFVLGEGAGILVLEELVHARARGAGILAELRGFGTSGDGHHITQPIPTGEGAVLSMKRCLHRSGVQIGDVAYINAHATSTPIGDDVEQRAIASLFSSSGNHPFVSSSKGSFGHMLGAAGAVEAAVTVLSLMHSIAPHTVNLKMPEPQILRNLVKGEPMSMPTDRIAALTNSFGFGGTNASLLFTPAPSI